MWTCSHRSFEPQADILFPSLLYGASQRAKSQSSQPPFLTVVISKTNLPTKDSSPKILKTTRKVMAGLFCVTSLRRIAKSWTPIQARLHPLVVPVQCDLAKTRSSRIQGLKEFKKSEEFGPLEPLGPLSICKKDKRQIRSTLA